LRIKLTNESVAAEEIIFAGKIVDVPLAAIDIVHQSNVGFLDWFFCWNVG
jgi:hypothetical protein